MANCLTALCFNMANVDAATAGVWLPLIPAGTFQGIDGRTWNNSNPNAIIQRFTKKRPFDVEHSTHIKAPNGEPAPAYGWITSLEIATARFGVCGIECRGREMIEERSTPSIPQRLVTIRKQVLSTASKVQVLPTIPT